MTSIDIPLRTYVGSSRDILYGSQNDDPSKDSDGPADQDAAGAKESERDERIVAESRANTSTSAEPSASVPDENAPGETRGGEGRQREPTDPDVLPPLPTTLAPMPYSQFYGDGLGGFNVEFRETYQISPDV